MTKQLDIIDTSECQQLCSVDCRHITISKDVTQNDNRCELFGTYKTTMDRLDECMSTPDVPVAVDKDRNLIIHFPPNPIGVYDALPPSPYHGAPHSCNT